MAIITPPTVAALPTAPTAENPASFDSLADGFIGALPTYRTQTNDLAQNMYNNAVEIASTIGASSIWVSGATLGTGVVRFSPQNGKNYITIAATSGADVTDPSAHPAKWKPVVPNVPGNLIYAMQLYGVF